MLQTHRRINVEWHERNSNLQQLVEEFNRTIQQSPQKKTTLDPLRDTVDRIYPLIQEEVLRLKDLSEEITKRKQQLNRKMWCTGSVSVSENIRDLTIINGIAKVCAVAGFSLAVLEKESVYAQWIGLGVFVAAEAFDAFATVYEAKLHLERAEASELAEINRDGVEHAEIFQKFLAKLKQIKETEERKKIAYQSRHENALEHHSFSPLETSLLSSDDHLDESIGDCLREYEELPKQYRKQDIQCFIISQLIQGLPANHPLRIGLDRLSPPELGKSISELATKPLTVQYLPNSIGNMRSRSSDDRSSEEGWRAEESAREENVEKEESSEEEIKEQYKREVALYGKEVMDHFGLNRRIPYFVTEKGWKLSVKEGFEKLEPASEEIHSQVVSDFNSPFCSNTDSDGQHPEATEKLKLGDEMV